MSSGAGSNIWQTAEQCFYSCGESWSAVRCCKSRCCWSDCAVASLQQHAVTLNCSCVVGQLKVATTPPPPSHPTSGRTPPNTSVRSNLLYHIHSYWLNRNKIHILGDMFHCKKIYIYIQIDMFKRRALAWSVSRISFVFSFPFYVNLECSHHQHVAW